MIKSDQLARLIAKKHQSLWLSNQDDRGASLAVAVSAAAR